MLCPSSAIRAIMSASDDMVSGTDP
jgi:hypothetical protein